MESSKEDRNQSSGSNFPSQRGRPNNTLMNETTIVKIHMEQNNAKNKNNSSNSVSPLNFDTQTIEGRSDSPMPRNTPSKQTSPYPSDNESSLYLSAKSQPSSPSFTKPPRNRSKKHKLQLQQQIQNNNNTNNKKKTQSNIAQNVHQQNENQSKIPETTQDRIDNVQHIQDLINNQHVDSNQATIQNQESTEQQIKQIEEKISQLQTQLQNLQQQSVHIPKEFQSSLEVTVGLEHFLIPPPNFAMVKMISFFKKQKTNQKKKEL